MHRWYEWGTGRYSRPDSIRWKGSAAGTFAYAEKQPLLFVDRIGLAPVKNSSGTFIPYKPEDGGDLALCAPGDTCDADGVFPPACGDFPINIVDGCRGEVRSDGTLLVLCPIFLPDAPGLFSKFPAAGQLIRGGPTNQQFHKDHPDWPLPNDKPFCGCEVPEPVVPE